MTHKLTQNNSRKKPSLYGVRWQKARAKYLAGVAALQAWPYPCCFICNRYGIRCKATVVDHIVPHKGNLTLFWDTDNWQALCKACHDSKTARRDGGFGRTNISLIPEHGCDEFGLPVAIEHPWNK